jgi:hypothetical protein
LVVANNDRVGLIVIRVSSILAGLAFTLFIARIGTMPAVVIGFPICFALLGYGLFGLLFIPIYGRIVADRQSGMIGAELERITPFNGPQGKYIRQKVLDCPYQHLTAINVVPGYSVLAAKRFSFLKGINTEKLHGYRIELVFQPEESLRIPFDTHDLTMEQAGLIHQWLANAGVRVELVEFSNPNGPIEASEVLNLIYVLVTILGIILMLLVRFLMLLLAR